MSAEKHQPAAVVHDLGYARYDGPRRPQAVRYRTIAGNLVRSSWRGFWTMKVWLIAAAITVFVLGTLMYVTEGLSSFRSAGLPVPRSDFLVLQSFDYLSSSAFFVTLMVTSSIIANDLRTGAFVFYFSRPLRPIDYVGGKVVGAVAIMAMVLFVGPLLLALFRLGMTDDSAVLGAVTIVPRTALMGAIATFTYAVVPLAFSAMATRRRLTVILWAAFYIVFGLAAEGVAQATGIDEIAVLSIPSALDAIALFLFGFEAGPGPALPPAWLAAAVLGAASASSLGFIYWRVSSAERAGLGGSR